MRSRQLVRLSVVVALQVLTAASLTGIYAATRNTLSNNGQWIATKTTLKKSTCGAQEFISTTQALAGNTLDLGAWHAFQEVIYHKKLSAAQVQFDFFLKKNAYVVFVFNKDATGFCGVRISNNPAFAHIYFTASDAGEFLSKVPLQIKNFKKSRWNRAKVVLQNNECSLFLNGSFIGSFAFAQLAGQSIGFRGSLRPALVDNVLVRDAAGRLLVKEDFANHRHYPVIFFCILCVLVAATAMVRHRVIAVCAGTLLFSFLFGQVLARYLARYTILTEAAKAEDDRSSYANAEAIYAHIKDAYRYAEPHVLRILFVGTSQTWGAGAVSEEDTFVRVTERELNRSAAGKAGFVCINGGANGMRCAGLWQVYLEELIPLNPHIVALNLASNDIATPRLAFYGCLQDFIIFNNSRRIKTVLIEEPHTFELENPELTTHGAMEYLARDMGVPVIRLHKYLYDDYDRGFMWWDYVHLTSFGQRLAGSYLAGELLKIIAQEIQPRPQ
jgi:hypothetical protein